MTAKNTQNYMDVCQDPNRFRIEQNYLNEKIIYNNEKGSSRPDLYGNKDDIVIDYKTGQNQDIPLKKRKIICKNTGAYAIVVMFIPQLDRPNYVYKCKTPEIRINQY